MPQFLIAALILWGLVTGLRWAAHADPKALVAGMKRGAGGVLLLGAGFLLLARGNPEAAAGIGALGFWLIGWLKTAPGFFRQFTRSRGRAQAPRVLRSATVELVMDVSGTITGQVIAGPWAGRALDGLSRQEAFALLESCRGADPQGAGLLELYLDRRFPGGGGAGDPDADARRKQRASASAMTEDHAYQLLGLEQGASREEVARAHRALMKKVHPDHGGTASLAALLNEARDILMRRHQ